MTGQNNQREGFHDRCARLIREYWAERGHTVVVGVKRAGGGYVIVSDLVGGLPNGCRIASKTMPPERAVRSEARERVCLNCGRSFLSDGYGNRLCGLCK